MLNHLLAGIVALGSLVLFLSGFFFPEVQRKPDLAWSGVALLYALLLFAEGDRTSGGALLGHIASVALILWFGWQTLAQRRLFAALEDQTAIPNSMETLTPFLKEGWGRIMVVYGEASSWVQEQLGKEDTSIAPEVLTQQSQDWDDTSTASEAVDSAVAVVSEPLVTDSAPETTPEPEPISAEAESTPSVTTIPEPPKVESPTPSATETSPESFIDSSEPKDPSSKTESPVGSHDAGEVELEAEVTAAHQESAPSPTIAPENPPSETEPALPVIKAEDATPDEPPAASSQPEDDESWPPPDPEA
jgi:Ycf66 protein N-terminus